MEDAAICFYKVPSFIQLFVIPFLLEVARAKGQHKNFFMIVNIKQGGQKTIHFIDESQMLL